MKNINQYNFDIIHVATHLRDTMEYVLPKEHDAKVLEQRKAVLVKGIESDTPLGKFLVANEEKFKTTIDEYKEMLEELYGEHSTILSKDGNGKVRVDHTQHIKIYKYVTEIMEPIRDVIYFHLNLARKQNENEAVLEDLMRLDDTYYRCFAFMLIMQDFQKSFYEFQKVMSESSGKPTPQSNYIVQNELAVMAKILRDVRSKNHFTDNRTLDALDECLRVVEMSEGRRDRRDNKPFPELFKSALDGLNAILVEVAPKWQELFNKALKEMLEDIKNKTNNPQA